jgi:hypothetical protein
MKHMRTILLLALTLLAATALSQSTNTIAPNQNYTITSFPLYGAEVTPSDTVPLAVPGQVRADEAGAVTVVCVGQELGDEIALTMVAGEFVPCVVKYVKDDGTDAIVLHAFY